MRNCLRLIANTAIICLSLMAVSNTYSRQIIEVDGLHATVDPSFSCAKEVLINVEATDVNAFKGNRMVLQKLLGGVRAALDFECDSIIKRFNIIGRVKGESVYRAYIQDQNNWRLANEILTQEKPAYQTARISSRNSSSRSQTTRISVENNSSRPNVIAVSDAEYKRAVEESLGVKFELIQPHPRSKLGRTIGSSPFGIKSVNQEGLAARYGVKVGHLLTKISSKAIADPEVFKQLTIEFICGRSDSLHLGMTVPMLMDWPSTYDPVIEERANVIPDQKICASSERVLTRQTKNYTYFNGFSETDGGIRHYFVRPNDPKQLEDLLEFLNKVVREILNDCNPKCEIHIMSGVGDTTIGKYAVLSHYGSKIIYDLTKDGHSVARNYNYDALAHLANLSVNDTELITTTLDYQTQVARLYYWFGRHYGNLCQKEIKNLSRIKQSIIETRTDSFGNSWKVNQKDSTYPIEKSFESRVIDYGEWYVWGLAELKVSSGISQFIEDYGCSSKPVANVRRNLLKFGNNHDQLRSKKGF